MTENILILTPYHDFGEMLRLGLAESQTYFPYLTHNSAEALLVASQDKFSLAIIDTEIPGPSFHDLWKDLKTMQPDMQLVLIFPESEDEYPSLDGLAPLGCVDHLLYMPEFLELIDSAFPSVEESIVIPAPEQKTTVQDNPQESQPVLHQAVETAWLEDAQIASTHLEKHLPICSAKAAMIARFDKVLAYSDQLEVSAAQEIANRFTRYWDKDSKNSDLVRFIHLGPMNNAYLLYVTALVNEAVVAALYQSDTPLSQPHREISKLARILLDEAPTSPKNDTGTLEMEFIDHPDDVFSQRMRMVTGSLNPMVTADRQEVPVENEITDQQEDEDLEDLEDVDDIGDDEFDPDQFHLEELLSKMPSPDPDVPEPLERTIPIRTQDDPNITQNAVESLRISWDSDDSVNEEPPTPAPHVPERKPYPWETDGSLDLPETPDGKIAETPYSRWKTNTDKLKTPEPTDPDTGGREPYPWEMESSNPEEPTLPAEDITETQPFPWELEADNAYEPETPTHDAVESLRAPWSDTGSLDAIPSSAPEATEPKPQKTGPLNSQENNEENLNYPWQTGTGSLAGSPPGETEEPDKTHGEVSPFTAQDAVESLRFPWESDDDSVEEPSFNQPAQPIEQPQDDQPVISQDAVEPPRNAWETHTAHLAPPPEGIDLPESPEQDAVESLRSPWETNTASLSEQPPNGHDEFEEDDFEPLPDFTDLESASESPLGNGWHREDDTQEVETEGEENGDTKAGTSPLKRAAVKAQFEEEEVEDDEYADCVYTYTTFVTPLLKRHALTRELAQILAKSMNTVCKNNHWKLINMTARPSGMLWTARIPPNVTTGQMVKIIREETSDMLYEIHPRLKYEALSENFWAANYLVVSGNDAPDDNSIKEFLQRIHQSNRSNGSRH